MKYVRGLLARNGLTDQKEDIVMEFTDGRTTHLRDMNYNEINDLINALKGGRTSRDVQINKILSMAHEMKWETADGRVDMSRLNAWCRKYTHQHKSLDQIPDNDLPQVVTIFQKVYMSFLKGL